MDFRVLPATVALNQAFKSDLAAFLAMDPEKLIHLRQVIGRGREMDEATLVEVQKATETTRDEATRLGYMMSYLLGRVVASEKSIDDLFADFESIVPGAISNNELAAAVRSALATTPEEQKYDANAAAFAFGVTYVGSGFFPVFAFGIGDKAEMLFPGFGWTISYQDSTGDREALTLNISTAELRALARKMLEAADDAEGRLRRLQGDA